MLPFVYPLITPLGGVSFAVPSRTAKRLARFYAAAQIVALFLAAGGLFITVSVWLNPGIPLLPGSIFGASAILLSSFFVYAVGEEIVEVRLDDDGMVFRTVRGRAPRLVYSRIAGVSCEKNILRPAQVPSHTVRIVPKGLRCILMFSISLALADEERPLFVAALRERMLRATGKDIGDAPPALAQIRRETRPAEQFRVLPLVCLLLLFLTPLAADVSDRYDHYLHERRIHEKGLRAAAVVDAVHREESASPFFLEPHYDFSFRYSYALVRGTGGCHAR